MKKIILLMPVLLLSGLLSFSQDVQFSPAVISSGGSSHSNDAVTISRWRIGQIHVITISSGENLQKQATVTNTLLPVDPSDKWSVTLFPNPVQSKLNIRFDMVNEGEFAFEIFDVTGRKKITENSRIISPDQVIEIDLTQLTPALYLLKIIPSGKDSYKQFKISKQ